MPKTHLGKWSVWLIIAFFLFFALFLLLAALGQRGPGFNPFLAATIIPAGIYGIAAFFTGTIAIIKEKERSVLVFISAWIGFFVMVFVLGEFLFPH